MRGVRRDTNTMSVFVIRLALRNDRVPVYREECGRRFELSCISDGLEKSQRGMMTGRRPLDGISALQSVNAYH